MLLVTVCAGNTASSTGVQTQSLLPVEKFPAIPPCLLPIFTLPKVFMKRLVTVLLWGNTSQVNLSNQDCLRGVSSVVFGTATQGPCSSTSGHIEQSSRREEIKILKDLHVYLKEKQKNSPFTGLAAITGRLGHS